MDVLEMEKGIIRKDESWANLQFIILAAMRNIREVDFHTFAMGTCLIPTSIDLEGLGVQGPLFHLDPYERLVFWCA